MYLVKKQVSMTSKYHIHRPTHGSARRKHMSLTATQNQECNLVKQSALSSSVKWLQTRKDNKYFITK